MSARLYAVQSTFYLVLIYGLPGIATLMLAKVLAAMPLGFLFAGFAPFVYALSFVLVAGLLSLPHQRGIVPGKFVRTIANPIYRHRRLYGLCWTALYYCKPVYYLCVTVPTLKAFTFRLFGYRGNLDFTIYADTWIRDLPLLSFGRGSYLGNRATIGSNQCFGNRILVDRITFDEGAELGHLAMVSPGVFVGKGAEIGVGAGVGLRAKIGAYSNVGACSGVGHGVNLGERVETGAMSYIANKSILADRTVVPAGTVLAKARFHPD